MAIAQINAGGISTEVKKTPNHSFDSLDLMRGLSAGAVMIGHTATSVTTNKSIAWLGLAGNFAVDVFMFISGFLMMWHFYERRNMGESWGKANTCLKFYTRRFFRIAPLYYCLLVLIYVFHDGLRQAEVQNQATLFLVPAGTHDPGDAALTTTQVLSHFSFVFGFIPRLAATTNFLPDWSIGLEMQFYLFFPFMAVLLVRSNFIGGVAALLAISWAALHLFAVGVNAEPKLLGNFPLPTFLPLRLSCFLAGMLMAAGLFQKQDGSQRAFLMLLGLLVAGLYMKKFLWVCFLFSFYELAINYGTGLAVLDQWAVTASRVVKLAIFKFLADASYGVYLIHVPLLIITIKLLRTFGGFADWPPFWRFLGCLAIVLPFAYLLAFFTHKYIELPGIALGRKIVKLIR